MLPTRPRAPLPHHYEQQKYPWRTHSAHRTLQRKGNLKIERNSLRNYVWYERGYYPLKNWMAPHGCPIYISELQVLARAWKEENERNLCPQDTLNHLEQMGLTQISSPYNFYQTWWFCLPFREWWFILTSLSGSSWKIFPLWIFLYWLC